jgi:DNA-directed RNA polymerase subunit omega
MLRPAVNQIISKNESCYSLVIAVAKRAREITDEYCKEATKNEGGKTITTPTKILEEKPVKTAVMDIASGRYRIVYGNPEKED